MRRSFVGGLAEGGVGLSVMDFARKHLGHVTRHASHPGVDTRHTSHPGVDTRHASHPGVSTLALPAVRRPPPRGCANVSTPRVGVHCDVATAVSLGNRYLGNASACARACCAERQCSCWTFTSYERLDTGGEWVSE